MKRQRYFQVGIVFLALAFLLALPLFAQTAPAAPAAPSPLDLGTRIVGIATLVATVLQGVKQYIPISGWGSRALAVAGAFTGAVVSAPAGQVTSLTTLAAAVVAALGAMGIHGLIKTASGTSTSAATN